jgi:hypothetical protein
MASDIPLSPPADPLDIPPHPDDPTCDILRAAQRGRPQGGQRADREVNNGPAGCVWGLPGRSNKLPTVYPKEGISMRRTFGELFSWVRPEAVVLDFALDEWCDEELSHHLILALLKMRFPNRIFVIDIDDHNKLSCFRDAVDAETGETAEEVLIALCMRNGGVLAAGFQSRPDNRIVNEAARRLREREFGRRA